jgi:hypothetical protein
MPTEDCQEESKNYFDKKSVKRDHFLMNFTLMFKLNTEKMVVFEKLLTVF